MEENSVCRNFRHTAEDGKTYNTKYYNLRAITSVGYRVNSHIEQLNLESGLRKSLHSFIEKGNHPYAVRMYAGKFKVEETKTPGGVPYFLINLPYYLETKIPEYIEYFVENF